MSERYVVELAALGGEDIVVADIAVINATLSDYVTELVHVFWGLKLFLFFFVT